MIFENGNTVTLIALASGAQHGVPVRRSSLPASHTLSLAPPSLPPFHGDSVGVSEDIPFALQVRNREGLDRGKKALRHPLLLEGFLKDASTCILALALTLESLRAMCHLQSFVCVMYRSTFVCTPCACQGGPCAPMREVERARDR